MTQHGSPEHTPPMFAFVRGPDRRHCATVSPPPYLTMAGLILHDRRSHLDRRAAWIKNFWIDGEPHNEH
ncbi:MULTISPECIES: hypothetical protein [Dechloromonas]|uniref:hypothetical protein n=1 Tax=Dechloromonas TaxID=73029 RepID=UPI001290E142|nr:MULTISPECIES: hypothetical protein [Dechloromonas]